MGSRTALATLVALVLATTKADEASSAAARAALLRRKGLELYAPQHQIEMVPGTAPVPGTNETARLLEAKAWFEKAVEADPSDATNHAYLGNACVRLDDLEGAERAYARALERETDYELTGKIANMRKALTIDPTQMAKELTDIEYLLSALEKAQEPFTKTTWSDTVDSWLGMRNLIKKLDSERAQHVLDCIFSDKQVLEALGGAVMFKNIADPDAVPGGVLVRLKAGPGKHIKERYYDYVKALKTEMAHIERLQSLQKQATGLIAIGLLALSTGVGNFVVRVLSNKLFYDEWVPEQPAPAN